MEDLFRRFANFAAAHTGSAGAFLLAVLVVLVWAASGPLFGFSDTWQLVINTGTTVVTFLMVFLIQNTQNRDSRAIHAKLDSLLISVKDADNSLVLAEDMSEKELQELKERLQQLAQATDEHLERRQRSRPKAK
jgi:low affinity Fe/Cu permease